MRKSVLTLLLLFIAMMMQAQQHLIMVPLSTREPTTLSRHRPYNCYARTAPISQAPSATRMDSSAFRLPKTAVICSR